MIMIDRLGPGVRVSASFFKIKIPHLVGRLVFFFLLSQPGEMSWVREKVSGHISALEALAH